LVSAPIRVAIRGKWEDLDADECERWLSTEQKLVDVLAGLLKLTPPKKKAWWPAFKELGRLRDSTVHLKASHAQPRTREPGASFYFDLLVVTSVMAFPRTAVGVAEYLYDGRERPPWLKSARELADDDGAGSLLPRTATD
jgi:hypothetical protein